MKIKITQNLLADRYPHFYINLKGKTIIDYEELNGGIEIKIKEKIKGAEYWDNWVQFHTLAPFKKEIKYIKSLIKKGGL